MPCASDPGIPPGNVLDVGGCHGQLVGPLAAAGWQVTVHGTDPQCEANLRGLHRRAHCEVLLGPLDRLPAKDRSFDLVVAVRLLPHVTNWQALLREMCRVARGSIVVDYPSKSGVNALTPAAVRREEVDRREYASLHQLLAKRSGARTGALGFRPMAEVRQFLMPMVVHRMGGGAAPLRLAERLFRGVGLTALAGSPVLLRADRQPASTGEAS